MLNLHYSLLPYFLLFFLILSFLYEPWLTKKLLTLRIPSLRLGSQTKFPPFAPSLIPPFGTDLVGFTLLSKLIQGFKYTFIIALLLSTVQVSSSFLLGFLTIRHQKKNLLALFFKYLSNLLSLIPRPFLVALLIVPIYYTAYLTESPNSQANQLLLIKQLWILSLISLPSLVEVFSSELLFLFKTDYSEASRMLGRSPWQLVRYTLKPQLTLLVSALFFKTMIQNLALFVYLAYFQLFLGGTMEIELELGAKYEISLSNEWSGIIGQAIKYLAVAPWTVLIPLAFYCSLIFMLSQANRALQTLLLGGEKYEIH